MFAQRQHICSTLINSGIPSEKFVFEGFLPIKKGRQARLKFLSVEKRTIIFYESPHRIVKTLSQICEYFGEYRKISVSREISKIYEENIRGHAKELRTYFENKKPKGEFVIVIEGQDEIRKIYSKKTIYNCRTL